MPIALPAPTAPELGSAEVLRGQGGAYVSAAFKQNQVHVIGPDVVEKSALESAISGAETLSDVVRRIQGTYYLAGYPAVRVVYALAEPDLYVQVTLGKVTAVEVPDRYQGYFGAVTAADPLTDEALERGRTFASVHADRAGESAIPQFKPAADGTSTLRIEPDDKGLSRSSMGLGFGNPGNRFVGRHFLDWFGRTSFGTGDELRATGRYGMEGLDHDGGSSGSDGYNEHTLGWGKVTPWGLFALQGRHTAYQLFRPVTAVLDTKFNGTIDEVELGWSGLLHASFYNRWGVGAKVDYTRKNYEFTDSDDASGLGIDPLLQRQEYGSVELSTEFSQLLNAIETPIELGAGLTVRKGMGKNERDDATVLADLGYLLFRPNVTAKVKFSDLLILRFVAVAQFTEDTLPEQQQWVMGGIGNVESYLPGVAAGDSGGIARLQYETTSWDLLSVNVVPRLFVEYGFAKIENPLDGQSSATQSLADAGVSLALVRGPFEASVSYAESIEEKKVDKDVLDAADANCFFRIAMKF